MLLVFSILGVAAEKPHWIWRNHRVLGRVQSWLQAILNWLKRLRRRLFPNNDSNLFKYYNYIPIEMYKTWLLVTSINFLRLIPPLIREIWRFLGKYSFPHPLLLIKGSNSSGINKKCCPLVFVRPFYWLWFIDLSFIVLKMSRFWRITWQKLNFNVSFFMFYF